MKDYHEIYDLLGSQIRREFCDSYLHCDVFHLTDILLRFEKVAI